MVTLNRNSVLLAAAILVLIGLMFFFVTKSDQPAETTGNQTAMGNATLPADNATLPAGNGTVPAGNAPIPAGNATVPANNATLPAYNATMPVGNATLPTDNATVAPPADVADSGGAAPDKGAADKAEADKAAAGKAAPDKTAPDKAAAGKTDSGKAAVTKDSDKAAVDKAAAKAASDKLAAQTAANKAVADKAASRWGEGGTAKSGASVADKATTADAGKSAGGGSVFRDKDASGKAVATEKTATDKTAVAEKSSTDKAATAQKTETAQAAVTTEKAGAGKPVAVTRTAAATTQSKGDTRVAGQDPAMLAGLEAHARGRVNIINKNIQPNRGAKQVVQSGGQYIARYYYVPEDSIRVSYRKTDPGTPFDYAGQVRYRECLYECTGSTKEEALNGTFNVVQSKGTTEIVRYVGNHWKD